jgi:phage replication O-like protein O
MANPQIENGYTKIANELLEALVRTPMRGEVWRIIMFVIRKTYGFNKTCDRISLSQFELGTGMKRINICRVLKEVVVNRLLLKTNNGYKLNKNYNQWLVVKRLPPSSQSANRGSSQSANQVVVNRLHTKETITKETYTKGNLKKLDGLKTFLEEKNIIK